MTLTIIASGSAANAYLLTADNGTKLLIEAGVHIDRIKQAVGYSFTHVAGCLVTHEHADHAKAAAGLLRLGVEVWASAGTHVALGTDTHHRARVIIPEVTVQVGPFKVRAFPVEHDAAEPFGFLIWHPESGTILFLTDSAYSTYKFDGLNNIIIEANYSLGILDRRLHDEETPRFLRDRIIRNHMNLETCVELLRANNLAAVNKIVLIHLSDGNSHERDFISAVRAAIGREAIIARDGLRIPHFNKTPF